MTTKRKYQQTLADEISLSGVGLHTGAFVNLKIKPANEGFGIRFLRTDLPDEIMVKADVDYVVDTSRGTTLEYKGARISTVEHLLASLTGMGVDNALITVDGPEVPILDGSGLEYVKAIRNAGIVQQKAEKHYIDILEPIFFHDKDKNVNMTAVPAEHFSVVAMIDFKADVVNTQYARMDRLENFEHEIASCRTFCFLSELEVLLNHNLIKGGDLSNAIVVVDKPVTDKELNRLAEIFQKPKIEVKHTGVLNNLDLQYPNELARHKLLDIVGDLTLTGYAVNASIIAERPGHSTNVAFAKTIKEYIKKNIHRFDVPKYDPAMPPAYDINKIMSSLPHKFPFLLVDKIIDLQAEKVVGIKNVTINEPFFQGHFPGNPIMPGVLQIEAMAQVGGILALRAYPDPENYDTYFLKIDKVKFKQKVVPGDTLILKLELLSPIRRGICEMKGIAYVGDKIVSEAELVAQIIPKSKREQDTK